jgi:DNA-binding CsgD family transcriptional regulator
MKITPGKNIAIIKTIEPLTSIDAFVQGLTRLAPKQDHTVDPVEFFSLKIKMMERFALGPYQWCIVDFATQQLVEVGGMIEEMTGKPYDYWVGATPQKYVSELAYPDDMHYWGAYVQFIYEYILRNPYQSKNRSLHPHVYIRMKNKVGEFRSVVLQFIDWMIEENGAVRYCLCQITDISHIKPNGPAQMTILEVKDGKDQLMISQAPALIPESSLLLPSFTVREKDVIRLLARGFTSKMIADELGIARNTVENHRQRLLKKSGCYTSSELIAYTISHGLL